MLSRFPVHIYLWQTIFFFISCSVDNRWICFFPTPFSKLYLAAKACVPSRLSPFLLSLFQHFLKPKFDFGCRNYVVQFILELKIPSATSKLTSQFEGNYVHLSTQKFSSHVVEKCLSLCNEDARVKIIRELLAAPCFDQLLQDPHANYVVQTALRVSEVFQ